MSSILPFRRVVQVCVLTYQRPGMLLHALESLRAQAGLDRHNLKLKVLVVDNDPDASAQWICDNAQDGPDVPIRYVHEPARGLACARNRALAESANVDLVAFLDDDEIADAYWLTRLVETLDRFHADVVTGPVFPRLQDAPSWIATGRFFDPTYKATGRVISHVATDNVLMRPSVFQNFRFDERFNKSGGEDTHFFLRVQKEGLRMVWADDALVETWVPPARANARWLIQRAFSDASRYTHARLSLDAGLPVCGSRLLRAAAGALSGAVLLLTAPLGKHFGVRALRLLARAAGTVTALLGYREAYYGGPHE